MKFTIRSFTLQTSWLFDTGLLLFMFDDKLISYSPKGGTLIYLQRFLCVKIHEISFKSFRYLTFLLMYCEYVLLSMPTVAIWLTRTTWSSRRSGTGGCCACSTNTSRSRQRRHATGGSRANYRAPLRPNEEHRRVGCAARCSSSVSQWSPCYWL